jgi:tRNA(Ile)-lysidine synthase
MPHRPPAVARVLERVTETAREHEMFLARQTVLVCVSGGPDSVCLLYSLWHLRRLFKIRLQVFHYDHRLRPGSSGDAAYVRRLSERLKMPFHLVVADEAPPKRASVEEWARTRRRLAAAYLARDLGAARIATAHTQDDQAETVLEWSLMGGGVRAIKPSIGPYVRPLIDVPRSDVEAFCRALHLRPRRDPMNRDTRFLRNAIRLKGIPALERATGRSIREPLARTAALVAEDDRELVGQMQAIWEEVYEETPDGANLMVEGLRSAPRPIATRLIGQAIFRCGRPSTRADVDAVLDLANGRPGRRRDLPSGLKARREREYVSLSRTSPESRE